MSSITYGAIPLILILLLQNGTTREAEAQCTAEQSAFFFDRYATSRYDGPAARGRLLIEVRALIDDYRGTAPECEGRLREHEAFLMVLNGQYAQTVDTLKAYLPARGTLASEKTQMSLRGQLSYALSELGRNVEAAQVSFDAASRADRVPAREGARALVRASTQARWLGDVAGAARYIQSALDLIADSLDSNPGLAEQAGVALVTKSILLKELTIRELDQNRRTALLGEIQRSTTSAIGSLTEDEYNAGRKAIAIALNSWALASTGKHAESTAQLPEAHRLARLGREMAPKAVLEVLDTEGQVLEMAGEYGRAQTSYERAYSESLRLDDLPQQSQILERLGRLAERDSNWTQASELYEESMMLAEVVRGRLGTDDISMTAFETLLGSYEGLVRVKLAQEQVQEALQVIDLTRARYLRDLREANRMKRATPDEGRAEVDSLSELRLQHRRAEQRATAVPEQLSHRRRISEIQGEIEEILGYKTTKQDTLDLGTLKNTLSSDETTMIVYFINELSSHAISVNSEGIFHTRINLDPIELYQLRKSAGGPWSTNGFDPAVSTHSLNLIYKSLVKPIEKWITGSRIIIIPDVATSTIPFGMLIINQNEDYKTSEYVINRYSITTELTPSLAYQHERSEFRGMTVLARSSFGEGAPGWANAPLPQARKEAERLKPYDGSAVYMDDEATEERFVSALSESSIVHVASHAEANRALPMYSRVALAPEGEDDGIVHLYEIVERPFEADLVVLSGCETASGEERRGEGIIGLQYGLRAAGAKATIATLWSVPDESMAFVMDAFYRNLEGGATKADALRMAQLAYLEAHDGLEASPFYWAAPILSGNPAPIPLERSSRWEYGVLVAMAMAGVAWWLRSRWVHAGP